MKNISISLLIVASLFLSYSSFAQSFAAKKLDFNNLQLKKVITDYNDYLKKFVADNKIRYHYVISLKSERSNDFSTFYLNAIYFPKDIYDFKPDFYTIINDVSVIIASEFNAVSSPEKEFFAFIKSTFLAADSLNESGLTPVAQSKLPDSLTVVDRGGTHKVPKTFMNVYKYDSGQLPYLPIRQKMWVLMFKGGLLFNQMESRFEVKSQ